MFERLRGALWTMHFFHSIGMVETPHHHKTVPSFFDMTIRKAAKISVLKKDNPPTGLNKWMGGIVYVRKTLSRWNIEREIERLLATSSASRTNVAVCRSQASVSVGVILVRMRPKLWLNSSLKLPASVCYHIWNSVAGGMSEMLQLVALSVSR